MATKRIVVKLAFICRFFAMTFDIGQDRNCFLAVLGMTGDCDGDERQTTRNRESEVKTRRGLLGNENGFCNSSSSSGCVFISSVR